MTLRNGDRVRSVFPETYGMLGTVVEAYYKKASKQVGGYLHRIKWDKVRSGRKIRTYHDCFVVYISPLEQLL